MQTIQKLDGSDWKLAGRMPNQVLKATSMEMGFMIVPAVGPIDATVPGAVQLDLWRAGIIENPYLGRNCEHSEWVNNREWQFSKTFSLSEDLKKAHRLLLCFEGLECAGEVYLNGQLLSEFHEMFLPLYLDISAEVCRDGENRLDVLFRRGPEADGSFGYTSRTRVFRSRFNFSWDWAPRMVAVGMFEPVYIKGFQYGRILDFYPKASDGEISAEVSFDALISGGYTFSYLVKDQKGRTVREEAFEETLHGGKQTVSHALSVENPEIWYPNNMGEQPLYTVSLEVSFTKKHCDSASKRVGFRTVSFVQNDNAPKGALPYTAVVNGERTFLRGVNWVPLSMFYGEVTRKDYEIAIGRLRDMNVNLLRVWGGAILEKEAFYDVCDEMGIMVWQEFPQSSSGVDNLPPSDDPEVMNRLKKIAQTYIIKRRHHASHIIWCSGNELMYDGRKPVDFFHRNVRMLDAVVKELDPGKIFLPSSASGPTFKQLEADFGKGIHHDVHGPWDYMGDEEHYRFFNHEDALFRSETGCPACMSMENIEHYSNGMPLWPPTAENRYWNFPGAYWIRFKEICELFGEFKENELKKYVDSTRLIQAEALRYAAEATRRREGETSGFIVWMGPESFPNVCNTSVFEFDKMTPKPSYYALKRAFSTLFASLKYDRIGYKSEETFEAEVFLHNEYGQKAEVSAEVLNAKGQVMASLKEKASEKGVTPVGKLSLGLTKLPYDIFFVRLTVNGQAENVYLFTIDKKASFESVRNLPTARVLLKQEGKEAMLQNISDIPAVGVWLSTEANETILENDFILLPGESRTVLLKSDAKVFVSGFNV